MDNAQSFDIALDSPLEASLEHNVVPVTQSTFAYNPQQPVSGLLMNAVKYEGNGVFCGKYRYDYDVRYTYKIVGTEGLEVNPPINPDIPNQAIDTNKHYSENVARNFYWYNEALAYAFDVSYKDDLYIRNMNFVCGFLIDNIVRRNAPTAKVVRTNYQAYGDDSIYYEGKADKYLVTGKTHLKEHDVNLSVDVYSRQLDNYVEGTDIPFNYEATTTFTSDIINTQVVHKTMDQDNLVLAMPLVIENGTASDFAINGINYSNGTTDLDTSAGTISITDSGAVTIPGTYAKSRPDTRFNEEAPINEYDEVFVKNTAPLFSGEGSYNPGDILVDYTTASTVVGMVNTLQPVVDIIEPSEDYPDIKVRLNRGSSNITASVTQGLAEAGATMSASAQARFFAAVVSSSPRINRPVSQAPLFWAFGQRGNLEISVEISQLIDRYDTVSAPPIEPIVREGTHSSGCRRRKEVALNEARAWVEENNFANPKEVHLSSLSPQLQSIVDLENSTVAIVNEYTRSCNGNSGDNRGYIDYVVTYVFHQPEVELQHVGLDLSTTTIVCRCVDIETASWVVSRGFVDSTFIRSAVISIRSNTCEPLESLDGFIIPITLRNTATSNASKLNNDLGIVVNYNTVRVGYINDIKFSASNRDSITLRQGDQSIVARLRLQEFDFFGTLTFENGIQIPNPEESLAAQGPTIIDGVLTNYDGTLVYDGDELKIRAAILWFRGALPQPPVMPPSIWPTEEQILAAVPGIDTVVLTALDIQAARDTWSGWEEFPTLSEWEETGTEWAFPEVFPIPTPDIDIPYNIWTITPPGSLFIRGNNYTFYPPMTALAATTGNTNDFDWSILFNPTVVPTEAQWYDTWLQPPQDYRLMTYLTIIGPGPQGTVIETPFLAYQTSSGAIMPSIFRLNGTSDTWYVVPIGSNSPVNTGVYYVPGATTGIVQRYEVIDLEVVPYPEDWNVPLLQDQQAVLNEFNTVWDFMHTKFLTALANINAEYAGQVATLTAWQEERFQEYLIDVVLVGKKEQFATNWFNVNRLPWQRNYIDTWFLEEVGDTGLVHRQCVWLEFYGETTTERLSRRHIFTLPYSISNNTMLDTNLIASQMRLALRNDVIEPGDRGHVRGDTSRLFTVVGGFVNPEYSFEEQLITLEEDDSIVPYTYSDMYVAFPTNSSDTATGQWMLHGVHDYTERRIRLRRAKLINATGMVVGTVLSSISGTIDNLFVRLNWSGDTSRQLVLRNRYGEWYWDAPLSTRLIELSYDNEFNRILRYSDGNWSVNYEFLFPTEFALLNLIVAAQDNADVYNGLIDILWMLFNGDDIASIRLELEEGILADYLDTTITDSTLRIRLEQILVGYENEPSRALYNRSQAGGVSRLVFRDADKLDIDYLPKGIYIRGNDQIQYKSYSHTVPSTGYWYAGTTFNYTSISNNLVADANVQVHSVDFDEEDGRAYVNVDIHDPVAGDMVSVTMANPDLDFVISEQIFDTDRATEDMWYIDNDNILQCTVSHFIHLRRVEGAWNELARRTRKFILGEQEEAIRFGVTSAVEGLPVMWLLSATTTGVALNIAELNPLGNYTESSRGLLDSIPYQAYGGFRNIPVAINFRDAYRQGYSQQELAFVGGVPSPMQFIHSIRITSTFVRDRLLLGIQYDKGCNQWTYVQSTQLNQTRVFNGYGCVGIDGLVTGSAVPMFAMSALSGLNVAIIDKPEPEEALTINRRAYIDGQSLVFMDESFTRGVCIAARFRGATWELKALPLRFNKYSMQANDSGSGKRSEIQAQHVAGANFGVAYFTGVWAWAYANAAIAYNGWVTSPNQSSETYARIEPIKEVAISDGPSNFWERTAMALAAMALEGTNNYVQTMTEAMSQFSWGDNSSWRLANAQSVGSAVGAISPIAGRLTSLQLQRDIVNEERPEDYTEGSDDPVHKEWKARLDKLDEQLETANKELNVGDVVSESLLSIARSIPVTDQRSVTATAIATSELNTAGLYRVGPQQNIYAGPGFVQAHFIRGSRVAGAYSWSHAARGEGVVFVPRIPSIPIPLAGSIDINAVTGTHPVNDFAPVSDTKIVPQPMFNIGPKHIIYSYPTQDIIEHDLVQTVIAPAIEIERINIIPRSSFNTIQRKAAYNKQKLVWSQWDDVDTIVDNCSLVQGTNSYMGGKETVEWPYAVDAGTEVFADPGTYDFCVYPASEMFFSATAGEVTGVSIRDTLVMDGVPSNVVIKNNMPLLASPYVCIEVSRTLTKDSIRPKVYSGDTIVFPTTGLNVIKGRNTYHGFDGYTNRIVKLVGDDHVDNAQMNSVFTYIKQCQFKTGSIFPPMHVMGRFSGAPLVDTYLHPVMLYARFMNNLDTATENLYGFRFVLPIVNKSLAYLPAAKMTYAPYKAHVIDGVTSLTTDIRTTSGRSKAYESQDFVIYGNTFRAGSEYLSALRTAEGTVAMQDMVATLGLKYLGSTPQVAWFYAPSANSFFTFTMANPTIGATSMQPMGDAFRFDDVESGTWDFIDQEIVFKAYLDRDIRLDKDPQIKDLIRADSSNFTGVIYPPHSGITDANKDFDITSTAIGLALQGLHRGQVARFVWHKYMWRNDITEGRFVGVPGFDLYLQKYNDGIQVNHGNWVRIKGDTLDDFWSERLYNRREIYGWYIEPFKLATSFLGLDEQTDCMFEWEITFALTPMMEKLLANRYTQVYLAAETQALGGGAYSAVTRLNMTAGLFGRKRVEGALISSETRTTYYSFRFNSRNGIGNSEKLYVWSDGPVAIKGIRLNIEPVTSTRTSQLTTHIDVQELQQL